MSGEPASPQLIAKMRKNGRREIVLAQPGDDDDLYLRLRGAEASVNWGMPQHIVARADVGKSALLEEFLHNTQFRLGMAVLEMSAGTHIEAAKV